MGVNVSNDDSGKLTFVSVLLTTKEHTQLA